MANTHLSRKAYKCLLHAYDGRHEAHIKTAFPWFPASWLLTGNQGSINTWWKEITHSGTFGSISSNAATRSRDFIDAARLRLISNTTPQTDQRKRLGFLFCFFFSLLSGTFKQKKRHNGWHRMVSTFPEDITNARPSKQLQASLKDMTDCPSMAKFKSNTAATAVAVAFHANVFLWTQSCSNSS